MEMGQWLKALFLAYFIGLFVMYLVPESNYRRLVRFGLILIFVVSMCTPVVDTVRRVVRIVQSGPSFSIETEGLQQRLEDYEKNMEEWYVGEMQRRFAEVE